MAMVSRADSTFVPTAITRRTPAARARSSAAAASPSRASRWAWVSITSGDGRVDAREERRRGLDAVGGDGHVRCHVLPAEIGLLAERGQDARSRLGEVGRQRHADRAYAVDELVQRAVELLGARIVLRQLPGF